MKKLADRVAVITGGGSERGIGRATGILLAEQGMKLVLADIDGEPGWRFREFVEASDAIPSAPRFSLPERAVEVVGACAPAKHAGRIPAAAEVANRITRSKVRYCHQRQRRRAPRIHSAMRPLQFGIG